MFACVCVCALREELGKETDLRRVFNSLTIYDNQVLLGLTIYQPTTTTPKKKKKGKTRVIRTQTSSIQQREKEKKNTISISIQKKY